MATVPLLKLTLLMIFKAFFKLFLNELLLSIFLSLSGIAFHSNGPWYLRLFRPSSGLNLLTSNCISLLEDLSLLSFFPNIFSVIHMMYVCMYVCKEVAKVCSHLKQGISGVLIDYEHVLFAPFWKHLSFLFQEFFLKGSICSTLKTGIISPLFKGKGAEANSKKTTEELHYLTM